MRVAITTNIPYKTYITHLFVYNPIKQKNAPTEVSALKNANSDCCYTNLNKNRLSPYISSSGFCIFIKSQNDEMPKKGIPRPNTFRVNTFLYLKFV